MDTPIEEEVRLKRKKKTTVALIIAAVVIALLVWLLRASLSSSVKRSSIITAVVETGDIENTVTASGEVLPEFEETISSPINASVQQVLLNAGSQVKAGQSVLTLDKSAAQTEYEKIKFQLESKRNDIRKLKLELDKSFYDIQSNNDVKQMMDELRRERTRQEQQHFFLEKLIHTSPTGIIILDFDQRIHDINPRTLQLLQAERAQLLSRSVYEISHPVIAQLRDLQAGDSKTFTYNNTATYKIQKSSFVDRGFPRQFIMIEELTAEILAAEKKAYGRVIRMMAHEVNNTIGSVNSILQSTIKADALWKNPEHDFLKDALQVAIERNYNLNVFMRNFADLVRLPEPRKKNINLPEMIQSIIKLIEMKAGEKNIQFIYDIPGDAFYTTADPQQVEQVLINIVKNAVEAIATEGYISFNINRYKRELAIVNNGKEINEAEAAQLFSPFFSTKKDGQGIGLMLVKEILTNHGFAFSLKTLEPGITAFVIRF